MGHMVIEIVYLAITLFFFSFIIQNVKYLKRSIELGDKTCLARAIASIVLGVLVITTLFLKFLLQHNFTL
ncbi:MAG: hypothetical protein K6D38_07505 [Pseudobutyrivibrio sp.]|nr:hypothetical protein [Pseudobutyrivibrio sp.]